MIEESVADLIKEAVKTMSFHWRLIVSVEYRIPWQPDDAAAFWKIVEENCENG